ncbi:hypothetical protein LENED_006303 [Lentinula edodes]|uniref:Uncharacterized protein n=1 Tax=Lentinula edodes TaxID=5353 RepID=A0A1Q3EBA3_LENED|nr:hypothetical protein LENED_006303 [Lentinula edodes]
MVNSCSILTALLVVGTVVLAVPIVPEGIISTGMPEGAVGFQPGSRSMDAESSEPGLPIRTRRHDVISREPPSAEGWPGSQSSRSFQRRYDEEVEKDADFLRNYPLPENYRQLMDVFNRMHRQPNTDLSAEDIEYLPKLIRKMGDIHTLIVTYIQGNGPSGTTAKNLAEIREGFEKGEDLDKLMKLTKS